jgi:hypothetical protein
MRGQAGSREKTRGRGVDREDGFTRSLLAPLKRPHMMLATLLLLGSVCVTVVLGIRGTSGEPPQGVDSVMLLLFAAVLQVCSAAVVSQDRRVHPAHARSAQRRVEAIVRLTLEWEQKVKQARRGDADLASTLAQLQVVLATINGEALASLLDWQEFNGSADS